MAPSTNLKLVTHPESFFHELLTGALQNQKITTQPDTEFYLVNLLKQFMNAENLFSRDADGNRTQEPLVLMVKEALEEQEPQAQKLLFRQVGDVSLYVAGYFQESLCRKLVDVDYYIDMGGSAYGQLAARWTEPPFHSIYRELSTRFKTFVDILAEISEKTFPKTEKDLLRTYELWVKTKSDRALKALQEAGIDPNETVKKSWQ